MKIVHTNIYLHTNTLKFVKRVSIPVVVWLEIVFIALNMSAHIWQNKTLTIYYFLNKNRHRSSKFLKKQKKKKPTNYQGTSSRCKNFIYFVNL